MAEKNFTAFPVLRTERLILRQLVSTDDNEIFALRSDNIVNKYLDRTPGRSVDDAKIFIRSINENILRNDSIYWAITLKGADKVIGTICLFDFSADSLKAEIGYELIPGFQGKGIMQEAFSKVIDFGIRHIGLDVIQAYTHPENQRSIRLLEKFDFKKNGAGEGNFMTYKFTSTGV